MAEPFIVSCPECSKQLHVQPDAVGKKIRCKGCEHVFPVTAPGQMQASAPKKAAPAGKPAKSAVPSNKSDAPSKPAKQAAPAKPAAPVKPAASMSAEDDEDGANPYAMSDMDLAARCPQCATAFDPPDSVICMECGFNTKTRTQVKTRTTKEMTGGDKFMWKLPGILGILGIIVLHGYWFYHHFQLPIEIYGPGWPIACEIFGRAEVVKKLADPESGGASAEAGPPGVGVNKQGPEHLEVPPGILWDMLKLSYKNQVKEEEARIKEAGELKGDWGAYLFHPGIELWILIMFLFASFYLGRLAIRRLILHPNPPEVVLK